MNNLKCICCMSFALFLAGCQTAEQRSGNVSVNSRIVEQDLDFRIAINKPGQALLLGEEHANKDCLKKEFEIWYTLYHKYGYRYLFIEAGYALGQSLNLWMKASNDEILEQLEKDWEHDKVQGKGNDVLKFYRKIKKLCPETIFYATDIEHQHESVGKRYLKYLESKGLRNSKEYKRVLECIEQKKACDKCEMPAHCYLEDKLVENFRREFDSLKDKRVVGIYGGFHTKLGGFKDIPTMADRLSAIYGGVVRIKDLTRKDKQSSNFSPMKGETDYILLVREEYANQNCLQKELELWNEYYHKYGFRHLFLEKGYATTEMLNLWMKSDDNKILNQLKKSWKEEFSADKILYVVEFYRKIKKLCPETVFHSTDMEYRHKTIGKQYLKYLEDNGLKDSSSYKLAVKSMNEAKKFENFYDAFWISREEMMVKNFVKAFNSLEGNSIMGIYGTFHVEDEYANDFSNMARRLSELYGSAIHRKDVTKEAKNPDDFTNIAHEFVEKSLRN